MKYIFSFLIALVLFSACEEVPVPMLPREVPPGNKTVLVEDFTGVSCPNCPDGARIIESTRTTPELKARIIPLAVHSVGFDNLHPGSTYQFKTEKGQLMQDDVGDLFSKPAAAINRTISPESSTRFYESKETWPNFIDEELNRPSEMNMTMELEYNASSRVVSFEVTYIPVLDINTPLNITAVIAESGMIDPQTDNSGVVEEFVHNHVLREVITAATGDVLGNSFTKGQIYTHDFSFTIPPEDGWWVAENCEIIVFINEFTPDSRRVLQALSQDVIE